MVNDGRDATVRVDLQELWGLLLLFTQVEIHRFIRQPEFFENDRDFPKNWFGSQVPMARGEAGSNIPAVRSTAVGIQSELLSVRHGWLVVAVVREVSEGTVLGACSPFVHPVCHLN